MEPMVFNEFSSRGHLDLIDMQLQPDKEYKCIFVYQDHLNKYVNLHALMTKCNEEVTDRLLDVSMGPRVYHNPIMEESLSMV